jgi:protease-4
VYSDGVAVIHIDGVIAGTSGGDPLFGGGEITPEYIVGLLRAADEDPGIEAIVLRIDSPGGTAAASQEIGTEVARMRKPVIASVGDVAASGAYWIASQCDAIVASPSSTVGSIGVIIQIPNYEGLLDKIGVEYTVLTKGEYKDAGSPFRSMNATELAMLDEDMEIIYQQFIDAVAEGRGMEADAVEELATGWAWTAQSGMELGLVDEFGTIEDAFDMAADEAGIESYEVIYYDEPSPWDIFYWFLTAKSGLGPFGETVLEGADAPPVAR